MTAALLVVYPIVFVTSGGLTFKPAADAKLIIFPKFCSIICFPTALLIKKVPVAFTCMTLFHASKGISSTGAPQVARSEEHTSELQSRFDHVCRLLLEK